MADNYLSESQLLLLANYEYFHCSTNNGTIKENIDALKSEDGSFDMDKVVFFKFQYTNHFNFIRFFVHLVTSVVLEVLLFVFLVKRSLNKLSKSLVRYV